jgi:hypothetical protein
MTQNLQFPSSKVEQSIQFLMLKVIDNVAELEDEVVGGAGGDVRRAEGN